MTSINANPGSGHAIGAHQKEKAIAHEKEVEAAKSGGHPAEAGAGDHVDVAKAKAYKDKEQAALEGYAGHGADESVAELLGQPGPAGATDSAGVRGMTDPELMDLSNRPGSLQAMQPEALRTLLQRLRSGHGDAAAWNDASGRVLAAIVQKHPGMLDRQLLVGSGDVGNNQLNGMVRALREQGGDPQQALARLAPESLDAMKEQMENGGDASLLNWTGASRALSDETRHIIDAARAAR